MRLLSLLLIIAVVVIIFIILGVLGCSAPAVQADRSAKVDFSQYRTFQWADNPGGSSPEINPMVAEPAIVRAVTDELTGLGFTEVASAPDLLVSYHLVVTAGLDRQQIGISPARPIAPELINLQGEGTLVVDLTDPKLNTVVWRGWSLRGLQNLASREPTNLQLVVGEILDQYPND